MPIKFQFNIDAPAETVFKAITTAKGYQGWWAKVCDIDCRPHRLSSIRFIKPDIVEEMVFETTSIQPNESLVWRCVSNNVFESMVGNMLHFTIQPGGASCLLTFVQSSDAPGWKNHPENADIKSGWRFFMQSLKAYCESGKGNPWG